MKEGTSSVISVHNRAGVDEPVDYMLKRLKRKMKQAGRFVEMRKREYFVKPSERLRQKRRRKKTVDGQDIAK